MSVDEQITGGKLNRNQEDNMDRGIKDEAFVRRALELADFDCGRWIANQAGFNQQASTPLAPLAKAAIVTSTAIYAQKAGFDDAEVKAALALATVGEARAFIDRLSPKVPRRE
ncbi:hypothetical protein [Cupriavidus basilensis]|uniref:Uncharacterized protein n=1 Tax=Cupriavidus basilensis TaxID=68895 RepID=A0A643FTY6_9BURK|nr:hypothetical protein [Cupriavidus basilensis]QOT79419.1 hypothetical protein F7R26_032355 [Cupriavidus basilensis]